MRDPKKLIRALRPATRAQQISLEEDGQLREGNRVGVVDTSLRAMDS